MTFVTRMQMNYHCPKELAVLIGAAGHSAKPDIRKTGKSYTGHNPSIAKSWP
jgi:hypothetical protein